MTITVPGSYLNFATVDKAGTTCFGGMQSDASVGFSIFGDVALKAAFVVFDGGNKQLGFATKSLTNVATAKGNTTQTSGKAQTGSTHGRNGH